MATTALPHAAAATPTPQRMRALVYERYGPPDVLRLATVALPTAGRREVLV
ncbi:hypothetical protein [Microbacterium sp. B24]|nr:hypothetical protein [Microbacterium sp. B24]